MSTQKTKRDKLREKILSSKAGARETITLFGEEVELRQPTLREVLSLQDEDNREKAAVQMIIRYCYVPETDEKVFEDGDVETLLDLPFGDDLTNLQKAIAKLTGIDTAEATKELNTNPS